jgi:hypothetical protein
MTVRQVNMPSVPQHVVTEIYNCVDQGTSAVVHDNYSWMPANEQIQTWCKNNISPDMYWGLQIISGDLKMHKDIGTQVKFNYIIDTAGPHVVTNFYNDSLELIESVTLHPHTWYIMDVTLYHSVSLVHPGQTRLSLTGRIFPTERINK